MAAPTTLDWNRVDAWLRAVRELREILGGTLGASDIESATAVQGAVIPLPDVIGTGRVAESLRVDNEDNGAA
jgi:hypothetical protein